VTESQPTPATAPSAPQPIRAKSPAVPLRPVIFIMAVFVGLFAVVAASKLWTPAERVQWRNDLPAALAESRSSNKPVLLYFTADWCGPCQWMKRNVFIDDAVAVAMHGRYIPVRIDHDQRNDLIVQYQVQGIPWFAVLDTDGNPTRKLERGVETPQEFVAWLRG
jgi:thioredoxin 1